MSQVMVAPDLVEAAATDLAAIGSALEAAHLDAAAPTLAIAPAAADEVSEGIAQMFSQQGADYQKVAGAAAAYHEQFVQHLTESAGAYATAEAAGAAGLLSPIAAVFGQLAGAFWTQSIQIFGEFASWLYVVNPALVAFLGGVALLSIIALLLLFVFTANFIFPAIPQPLLTLFSVLFG